MEQGSWLFPQGVDRRRMLEMDAYLQPVRRATFAVVAVALVVMGPWLGWWTVAPVVLAAVAFRLAERSIGRLEHPEYAIFGAWVASQVIIAVAVAISGGADVPTLSWLAIPIVTLGARFSQRGIVLGVAITIALLLAVAFATDAAAVADDWSLVIAPITLIVAVAMFQTVVMRSDVKHRAQAVVDPLTEVLNRNALTHRVAELEEQSRVARLPVGVIVGDLDNFKEINDRFGHTCGDAVLSSVAHQLRQELRAFDLLYRIGGEEFLVLVPGADHEGVRGLAEDLRASVAGADHADHAMTMSFGVAVSPQGQAFEYTSVFEAADAALYEAKSDGRNCVRVGARRDLGRRDDSPAAVPVGT
jgi:diguanylate cyclase (GGDEF)-like protein